MTTLHTAIVGGGLAGMSLASDLWRQGNPVAVFEKEAIPGGKGRSIREDGLVVELGPLGWLDREPCVGELLRDLDLEPVPSSASASSRSLLVNSKLKPLPEGALSFLGSPLLSPWAKVRLAMEPFIPARRDGEESINSFATRRFGKGVADTFFAAMVSGIFGGDPERLSVHAAFPLMASWEEESGSCVRGAIRHLRKKRRALKAGELAKTSGSLMTLPGGLADLTDAIAERIGDGFHGESAPDAIGRDGDLWVLMKDGKELARSERLALATPADVAVRLLRDAPRNDRDLGAWNDALSAAEAIPGSPLVVVSATFPSENIQGDVDGFGFIALREQGFRPLGVQFPSSIFPSQTPRGLVQLRILMGGAFDSKLLELDDDTLTAEALEPVRELLGIKGEPAGTWLRRVPEGIPQYTLGHLARIQAMNSLENAMGTLSFCGDSVHGVGVNKVVERAIRVARSRPQG